METNKLKSTTFCRRQITSDQRLHLFSLPIQQFLYEAEAESVMKTYASWRGLMTLFSWYESGIHNTL